MPLNAPPPEELGSPQVSRRPKCVIVIRAISPKTDACSVSDHAMGRFSESRSSRTSTCRIFNRYLAGPESSG